MKVTSVKALALDVGFQNAPLATERVAAPMSRWPQYAESRSSWMWPTKKVFVRLESDEGIVGWSVTNGGEVVALIINSLFARLVTNSPIDSISEFWDQMTNALLPVDRSGFAMMAVSGVDIALWDLKAKSKGVSLVNLLGGAKEESVKTYATTTSPELHANKGWWGLKAPMPYGIEGSDEGMVKNIDLMHKFRDAAGKDGRIMLDAFMAWDVDYTLRFLEQSNHLDIFWIEDPLPPQDLDGFRQIKKVAGDSIRLALGNFCFSRWDCQVLIRERLVDFLQPDIAWVGGITEALRILDMAKAAKIPIIFHNTFEQPWAVSMASACQDKAVIEFVDRGSESQIYSLMGPTLHRQDGCVWVPNSTRGNTPPEDIEAQFDNFDCN